MSLLYAADYPHECCPPGGTMSQAPNAPGSVWKCDQCDTYWIVKDHYVWRWVPISTRKARRLLRRASGGRLG